MQDLGKRMETMVYNLGDSHFFYNDLDVSLPSALSPCSLPLHSPSGL